MDRELSQSELTEQFVPSEDSMKTVRVDDIYPEECDAMQDQDDVRSCTSSLVVEPTVVAVDSTTTSLPSPLLCPRRAFLAALILASKFSQDKCYSNRAWAKLSGLPPREIGRCERALGQALDWRLWVGKNPAAPQSPTPAATSSSTPLRTVVRSQSESTIASPSSSRAPFFNPMQETAIATLAPTDILPATGGLSKGLRKCTTLPAESFVTRLPAPTSSVTQERSCDVAISAYHLGPDRVLDASLNDRKQLSQATYPFIQSATGYSTSDSSSSSSPDTPPLSYSPSTTDCSSNGDRTIQMSSFEEGSFPSIIGSQSWLEVSDPRFGPIRTASPASFYGSNPSDSNTTGADAYLASRFALSLAAFQANASAKAQAMPPFGGVANAFAAPRRGPYLWHADGGYASLESARVY